MPFLDDSEFLLLMDNPLTAPTGEAVFDFTKRTQERHAHISEEDLKKLHGVGIRTTMPFLCLWDEIEPEKGKYNWSYLDSYVNRAARAGMKTILFTCTGGYPNWMPDDYFCVCKDREGFAVVHREALSPWNEEAMAVNLDFMKKIRDRYSTRQCLVVSAQLSCGETILLNEPAFYDPRAIASYQYYADTDTPPTPEEPMTENWLRDSYLSMLLNQQRVMAENAFREIFVMLHPAIADFPGLYGNGNKWIWDVLYELSSSIPDVKINHIYYTWIQWQPYWGRMNEMRARFNENVFGGAEYAEGLPTTTPYAIANGLRGQIISPCYPGIHDNGVEDWMLANISTAQATWMASKRA